MESKPILIENLFTLPFFKNIQNGYTLKNTSLQSDKYTLIRDSVYGRGYIHVYNNDNTKISFKTGFYVESAHLCFDKLIIALKSHT